MCHATHYCVIHVLRMVGFTTAKGRAPKTSKKLNIAMEELPYQKEKKRHKKKKESAFIIYTIHRDVTKSADQ